MIATAIRTPRITPSAQSLLSLLDAVLPDTLMENSVVAITSKIVSLCEGSVRPLEGTDKAELLAAEADLLLAEPDSKWGIQFSIKEHTLIPNAGVDESNAGDVYVLWPRDAQATANAVRSYLVQRYGHDLIAVIITDSTCHPLRRGVTGIALAYSGLQPLHNYIGQPDLFDRPFTVSQADIVGGLAATAVLMMGEGAESTPLVLMSDVSVAEFTGRNPTIEELSSTQIDMADDLFAPFLEKVLWQPGGSSPKR